ncbi:DUF1501 domain-containing protein [Limnohabitans sp. 15K]|uniref:DUF1501 domain-containing protein n=1 Tax=Limnohabitans sp. 15K TaxID=1100706 RepID=UPI000C1E0937|nr:DUF1501 domain-containing protein [Limnohabitans sp. 15K]PIT81357.1 Tat pathway signal protein [Limnohabitans sp. 15K]
MHLLQNDKHTRRAFLQRAGQLGLAGVATPLALNLAAMGEAAAFGATDYKALVCVFLYGGNDYANTVVTYDPDRHAQYAGIRAAGAGTSAGGIVLERSALSNTVLKPRVPLRNEKFYASNYELQYALHPALVNTAKLFNNGQAAVQLNVGPLVVPLTRQQYNSQQTQLYPLPPKLFSHNDQQSLWQASSPEGSTTGWGGKIGDLALSSNSDSLFSCISVTGNSVFLSGNNALQYQCSTDGAIAVRSLNDQYFYQPAMRDAFGQMLRQTSPHLLKNEYNAVMRRALSSESKVTNALAGVNLQTPFPAGQNKYNSLTDQLKMVAKLIGARNTLGAKRQVFMVSLGGFDLHDNLIARQPTLLAEVDQAINAFYNATVELGVADKVTTFTASDFGRTLTSNGDGSDHGWGSHHLIVGGAVKGAAFYGEAPPVSVGDTSKPEDQWHVGQGRLLPSTSVDQFAATLATWFGVAPSELNGILPNLKHFGSAAGRPDYPTQLGFV